MSAYLSICIEDAPTVKKAVELIKGHATVHGYKGLLAFSNSRGVRVFCPLSGGAELMGQKFLWYLAMRELFAPDGLDEELANVYTETFDDGALIITFVGDCSCAHNGYDEKRLIEYAAECLHVSSLGVAAGH